jgi:hypothetical protein
MLQSHGWPAQHIHAQAQAATAEKLYVFCVQYLSAGQTALSTLQHVPAVTGVWAACIIACTKFSRIHMLPPGGPVLTMVLHSADNPAAAAAYGISCCINGKPTSGGRVRHSPWRYWQTASSSGCSAARKACRALCSCFGVQTGPRTQL